METAKSFDESLVDYAYPCLMAEKYLKELHNAVLKGNYDAAIEFGLQAMVEVKITINAIRHEKEKANELARTQD